jgi:pantoate kinase
LDQGVTASARFANANAPAGIFVAGKQWAFPTVAFVLEALNATQVRIDLEAAFPFGCGFGMSGASALATAYAVNELLRRGRTESELGKIAHDAEVAAATGLGDVGGQFNGGIMIKTIKFQPLTVSQLPVKTDQLHVQILGPIHTAEVIDSTEKLRHINAAGHTALQKLNAAGNTLTLSELFEVSLEFAKASHLVTNQTMIDTIAAIRAAGGYATMIMLGEAIVSTIPFPQSQAVRVVYRGAHLLP